MGAELHGLVEVLGDLHQAKADALPEVKKVVSKGALNIKNDIRDAWRGIRHAPALPRAVTYDVTEHGYSVSAEIGPDKAKRQGALGNLIEFGSVNNAPHPAVYPALDREETRFYSALEDLAEKLLEGS